MKDMIKLYIVKTKLGYFSCATKFCVALTTRKHNAALLDYNDACAIAFDMNKQQESLDYAVIERVV
jgi:hypothetical protein